MKYLPFASACTGILLCAVIGNYDHAAIYFAAMLAISTTIIFNERPPRDAEIAALTIERDLWSQSEEIASRQHDKRAEELSQLQSIARKAADFYDAYRNHEDDIQAAHDALGAAIIAYADRARP